MVKPISSIQLFGLTNITKGGNGGSNSQDFSQKIKELEKADKEIKEIAQYGSDVSTANTQAISQISEDVEQSKKDILELKATVKPKTEEPTDTPQGQIYLKALYQEPEKQVVINSKTTNILMMTHDQYKKIPVSYRDDIMGGIWLKFKFGNEYFEKTLPVFYFNNFNSFRHPFSDKISFNTPEGLLEGIIKVRMGNALYVEFERTNEVNTTLTVEHKCMINVGKTV